MLKIAFATHAGLAAEETIPVTAYSLSRDSVSPVTAGFVVLVIA